MINQSAEHPNVEQRLTDMESRSAALETVMTQFIEEQRAYREGERERQEHSRARRERKPSNCKAQKERHKRRAEQRECNYDSNRRYAGLTRVEKRIDKMCFGLFTSDSNRAFCIRLAIMIAWSAVIGWHIGSTL